MRKQKLPVEQERLYVRTRHNLERVVHFLKPKLYFSTEL